MPTIAELATRAQNLAPIDLRTVFGPLYYRYLSIQANRAHSPEDLINPDPDPTAPDHVLIVVIDALRPDTVPDLPLDFDRAVAPGTWTFPSVTSMQTGLEPHEHGAVAHTHPDDDHYAIPAQYDVSPTLPHVIERSGYDTYLGAAFITPFLALKGWFQFHRVYGDVDAEQVINDYRDWRASRNRTYAYLQLGDLHAPIEPPETYIEARNVDTTLNGLPSLMKYTDDYDSAPEDWREQRLRLYCAALDYVTRLCTFK